MNIEEREKREVENVERWIDLFDLVREQSYNSSINRDTMNTSIRLWIESVRRAIKKEVGV